MESFNAYSQYYNLIYKDKNYEGEANFVHDLIQEFAPTSKDILDLGSGSGSHDFFLAKKGYSLTGVDSSDTMLAMAGSSLDSFPGEKNSIEFLKGDIRSLHLNRKFDAVISLFHVMSYQAGNNDLKMAFKTVHEHLKPEGIFIFDIWYGPAVQSQKPSIRRKKLNDDICQVIRVAEPEMFTDKNIVDVNYTIRTEDHKTGEVREVKETHRMRYFFRPEIELLAKGTEFRIIECKEWMTGNEPGSNTWSVYFIMVLSNE